MKRHCTSQSPNLTSIVPCTPSSYSAKSALHDRPKTLEKVEVAKEGTQRLSQTATLLSTPKHRGRTTSVCVGTIWVALREPATQRYLNSSLGVYPNHWASETARPARASNTKGVSANSLDNRHMTPQGHQGPVTLGKVRRIDVFQTKGVSARASNTKGVSAKWPDNRHMPPQGHQGPATLGRVRRIDVFQSLSPLKSIAIIGHGK